MTVTIHIPSDIETALVAQARAQGLDLDQYVEHLLRERAAGTGKPRASGRKSLARLFAESPLKGLDLKFERDGDTGRPVKL